MLPGLSFFNEYLQQTKESMVATSLVLCHQRPRGFVHFKWKISNMEDIKKHPCYRLLQVKELCFQHYLLGKLVVANRLRERACLNYGKYVRYSGLQKSLYKLCINLCLLKWFFLVSSVKYLIHLPLFAQFEFD